MSCLFEHGDSTWFPLQRWVDKKLHSFKKKQKQKNIRVRTRNEFIGFVISLNLITNIYVNEWCLIEFTVLGSLHSLLF